MVHMTPDGSPKLPVEQLARFLLECGRADPALLARSSPEPMMPMEPFARPALIPLDGLLALKPGAPGTRTAPEMEELVSIAVACARRAEDALQHAREVSWGARRRMSIVAALTGAGIAAGVTIIVLDRDRAVADPRLTEVASAMRNVSNMQKETVAQLAEVRSNVAAMRDNAPAVQPAQREDDPGRDDPGPVEVATAADVGSTPAAEPTQAPVTAADAAVVQPEPQPPPPLPMTAADAAVVQPEPQPSPPPRSIQPRPHVNHAHYVAHYYRRPAWQAGRPPSVPAVFTQVFADVRRNINAIFH
jgi:hypothetical protein